MTLFACITKALPLLGHIIPKLNATSIASLAAPSVRLMSQGILAPVQPHALVRTGGLAIQSSAQVTRPVQTPTQLCVRCKSGRYVCEEPEKKDPCKKVKHRCAKPKRIVRKRGEVVKKPPFKTMWESRECCVDECSEVYRTDLYFYKLEDKTRKRYNRTWNKCANFAMKRKRLCRPEKIDLPPMPRRKFKPKTACKFVPDECEKEKKKHDCPRTTMKGCRVARIPPRCVPDRVPADCTKVYAPRPAYSECEKDDPKPLPPVECDCLRVRSMCSAYAYLRQKGGRI